MPYKKLNNLTGWAVFAIATLVYLMTMEQTTSLWDCGEYITTANKLEVGHPPGAPFFMLLGRLFSAFASPANAAMMVNALSALSSSFTILFLFWTISMLGRKLALKSGEISKEKTIAIIGSGAIGALAYTFTDSFWFSAVEGEVYAMSSLFTAIVFWAILKWDLEVDEYENSLSEETSFLGHPNRWILFISYMIGLSIGVHLLNLLAIPAIAFVVYFKKFKFNWKSFIITGILSLVILASIQDVIIPKTVSVADWFERLFKNSLGLPFNSGAFFFLLVTISLIVLGIRYTSKKNKEIWNTIIVSFALLLIGYSSFVMIVVRSNANPPLDENNPESLSQLHSYLKREQYGSWPVLSGQYWNSPVNSGCSAEDLGPDKSSYMKVFSLNSNSTFLEIQSTDSSKIKNLIYPIKLHANFIPSKKEDTVRVTIQEKELTFMNVWELNNYLEKSKKVNLNLKENGFKPFIFFDKEIGEKYINTLEGKKGDRQFNKQYTTLFPRMYRQGEGQKYMAWCNYEVDPTTEIYVYGGNEDKPLPLGQGFDRPTYYEQLKIAEEFEEAKNIGLEGLYMPSFSENISYLFNYQIGWMYGRYFLWNFAGRQNDVQGYGVSGGGSKILEGNWLSGLDFIDEQRLGNQQDLPANLGANKAYNVYYMLPLILGLIGFFFQMKKHPKGWFTVLLLFLLTGLAIVIYLNQKPAEPRERDYAYAASFYAFAIWIGLGVYALYDASKNMSWKGLGTLAAYSIGGSIVILGIQSISGGNTAFGYALLFISVIGLGAHLLMIFLGDQLKNSLLCAGIPIILCTAVPVILAMENWDDHDRSNRSTARDFAYNYLMSCDYNAILFTNGDNDTFPLWYIQEVEGVRTDVRVANMSLLSTDWHINHMKKKAYESDPLPISMNENVYRSGKRDYIILDEKENKKYKNYAFKKYKLNQFNKTKDKFNKMVENLQVNPELNTSRVQNILTELYLIKNYLTVVNSEKEDLTMKTLKSSTLDSLNKNRLNSQQLAEIEGIKIQLESLKEAGITFDQQQYQDIISNLMRQLQSIEKNISDLFNAWPQIWYTAQEAIDFIGNEKHKKNYYRYSCNQEYYLDFKNVYIPVNMENALSYGILKEDQLSSPLLQDTIRWRLRGSMLYKADLAVLDLLANYKWDRPIYFASIVGMQANENLNKYMQSEGMTYKLTPLRYSEGSGYNTEKMVQLMTSGYELKKPAGTVDTVKFLWGNMHGNGVLVDYYTMRMVTNIRHQFMMLTSELIKEGKNEDAITILDKVFEVMPVDDNQVPADDRCFYLCANYYEAGDTVKGNELAKKLIDLELKKLKHYLSFDDQFFDHVWPEFGKAMNNLEMIREASVSNDALACIGQFRNYYYYQNDIKQAYNALAQAADNPDNPSYFKDLGALKNSDFKEVFLAVKNKFFNHVNTRQKFFFNAQKFPVCYSVLWYGNRL